MTSHTPPRWRLAQLNELPPAACPCGTTRRAFAESDQGPASVHLVQIDAEARLHYHQRLTEIYVVLEGEGYLELDGKQVPVAPLSAIMILPGCRHRAVGDLKILNIAIPAFDPTDEWFDDPV